MIPKRKSASHMKNKRQQQLEYGRRSRQSSLAGSCMKSSSSLSVSDTSKSVSFGSVTVTAFEQTVGDNPACSSGCPIALEPLHCSVETYASVGKYYRHTVASRPTSYGSRRGRDLMLSAARRKVHLQDLGYTLDQMVEAAREAHFVRKQRMESLEITSWEKMWKTIVPKYIVKSLKKHSPTKQKSSTAVTA